MWLTKVSWFFQINFPDTSVSIIMIRLFFYATLSKRMRYNECGNRVHRNTEKSRGYRMSSTIYSSPAIVAGTSLALLGAGCAAFKQAFQGTEVLAADEAEQELRTVVPVHEPVGARAQHTWSSCDLALAFGIVVFGGVAIFRARHSIRAAAREAFSVNPSQRLIKGKNKGIEHYQAQGLRVENVIPNHPQADEVSRQGTYKFLMPTLQRLLLTYDERGRGSRLLPWLLRNCRAPHEVTVLTYVYNLFSDEEIARLTPQEKGTLIQLLRPSATNFLDEMPPTRRDFFLDLINNHLDFFLGAPELLVQAVDVAQRNHSLRINRPWFEGRRLIRNEVLRLNTDIIDQTREDLMAFVGESPAPQQRRLLVAFMQAFPGSRD